MAGKGKARAPKQGLSKQQLDQWADAPIRAVHEQRGATPDAKPAPNAPAEAGAPWRTDQTSANLQAWAERPGMPEHLLEPGAMEQANAVDRREAPSFAPGLARLNMAVHRASDPDDTANDLSLMPSARMHSDLGSMRGSFNAAERHYDDSHMHSHAPNQQPETPSGPSGKPRGFQIHKVQAAAQAARGAQYNGPDDDGTN